MDKETKMAKMQDDSFTDFARLVTSVGSGDLNAALSAKLNELVRRVQETHKGGKVTLTLEVKPAGDIGMMVSVTGRIASKMPELTQAGSILYTKDDGTLHQEDPRQLKLKTLEPVRQFRPTTVAASKPAPAETEAAANATNDKSED